MKVLNRKERKKLRRHQQILEAAYKVFQETGYSAATMDMIAESADLAKGTIYIYFKSKEELYFSLLVNGLDILIELLENMAANNHPQEKILEETARTLLHFYTEYKDYFRIFLVTQQEDIQNKLSDELAHEINSRAAIMLKILDEHVKLLIGNGDFKSIEPRLITNILWGVFNGITQLAVTREQFNINSGDEHELLYMCFDLINRGLNIKQADMKN